MMEKKDEVEEKEGVFPPENEALRKAGLVAEIRIYVDYPRYIYPYAQHILWKIQLWEKKGGKRRATFSQNVWPSIRGEIRKWWCLGWSPHKIYNELCSIFKGEEEIDDEEEDWEEIEEETEEV